jgi:acetoin utilization deacetylase AcuC-like enzyme
MPSRREFLGHAGALVLLAEDSGQPASRSSTVVLSDVATMLRHQPSPGHPESPSRLEAVASAVKDSRFVLETAKPATEEEILRVHSPEYLKRVRTDVAAGVKTLSTGDTEISRGSLTAALAAAGTVVSGVDAVLTGRARRAFCAVRPPGHHASAGRGMGFCVFNNVAVGARHAQRRHGVGRILIADWDVHHGNGTQDVFWSDGSVMFFDTHQHPWYPGTGSQVETGGGKARGLIFNRPFPAGSGRREIVAAFREALVPAAERFKPELVMISAGFDSRAGDPLGQFTLTDADFGDLTDIVVEIARQHAGGRVISVLEGGYSLDGLSRAVTSHLGRLSA